MNIDRVAPGAGRVASAGAAPSAGRFDLTVSDRGVHRHRIEAPRPAPVSEPQAAPLTSSPALEKLLSAEESQALREAFAESGPAGKNLGVYGARGTAARLQEAPRNGGLLDVTG